MTNDKGILIKNIYYMLSYAFQVLNEQGYKQVATEEFENVAGLGIIGTIENKKIILYIVFVCILF